MRFLINICSQQMVSIWNYINLERQNTIKREWQNEKGILFNRCVYDYHVYGYNGLHLGWFLDNIVYDSEGKRIGFTSTSCPIPVYKETGKAKKYPLDKAGPRTEPPPLPDLGFDYSSEDFEEFLRKGQVTL